LKRTDEATGAWVSGRLLVGAFTDEHADEAYYSDFAPYADIVSTRDEERVLFVAGVYVPTEHRGQRLGLRLLDELTEELEADRDVLVAQEFETPSAWVHPARLELYYFNAGFRRIGWTMERCPLMQRVH
jgi:GNAT superfamily N-acetyltransferase